jgi:hypothetical protein
VFPIAASCLASRSFSLPFVSAYLPILHSLFYPIISIASLPSFSMLSHAVSQTLFLAVHYYSALGFFCAYCVSLCLISQTLCASIIFCRTIVSALSSNISKLCSILFPQIPHSFSMLSSILSHTFSSATAFSYFYISNTGFNDLVGRLAFVSFFISSNLLFFPLHSLGIMGFPRRVFDFPISFYRFNWLSSISLIGIGLSLCLFLLSFYL